MIIVSQSYYITTKYAVNHKFDVKDHLQYGPEMSGDEEYYENMYTFHATDIEMRNIFLFQ